MNNSWQKIDVVFDVKSPLHIGYLPSKGSVISHTRYFIPGKNFWGAITKKVTESIYQKPNARHYQIIGKEIKDNFRFSYFYIFYNNKILNPIYRSNGLFYGLNGIISKTKFEHIFIGSQISTAIDSKTKISFDKSLHELEYIKNTYRNENSCLHTTQIIGSIWIKHNCQIANDVNLIINSNDDPGIFLNDTDINLIDQLTIGGEQNYGFGLVKIKSLLYDKLKIDYKTNSTNVKILVKPINPLTYHLKYEENLSFKGELEIISGREYQYDSDNASKDITNSFKRNPGKRIVIPEYYYSPGTKIECNQPFEAILQWNGFLKKAD